MSVSGCRDVEACSAGKVRSVLLGSGFAVGGRVGAQLVSTPTGLSGGFGATGVH